MGIAVELGSMFVNYKARTDDLVKGMSTSKTAMSSADAVAQSTGKNIASSFSSAGKSIADFGSKTVSIIDVAKAKIVLIEDQVRKARDEIKRIEGAADAGEAVTGLEQARAKLVLLQNEAQKARNHLGDLESNAQRAGGSFSGSFSSGVRSAGSSLLDFASKASMAGYGIVGLIGGVMSFGQSLLAPNASMEQTHVSFGAFIEDANLLNTTLGQLKNFGATTPFESTEVNAAALSLLNMEVAAKDLTTWLGNIGAATSKVGLSGQQFKDVTAIIAQMGVEGRITTGELMQLQERNIPAFKLLAKEMGVSVSQLKQMISSNDELIMGTDKVEKFVQVLGQFGGDAMTEQSKTFNGLLSTFKDNAGLALSAFSGPLFDKAKGGLTELGNLVSSPSFQQFATIMGERVGGAIGHVASGFRTLVSIGTQVVFFFQQHQAALVALQVVGIAVAGGLFAMMVVGFTSWAIAAGAAAIATLAATWPILAIGAVIALVVAGIIVAVQHWADITKWFQGIWGAFVGWWQSNWDNILNIAKIAGLVLLTIMTGGTALIVFMIVSHWTQIWSFLVGIWQNIQKAFSNAGSFFAGIGMSMWNGMKGGINLIVSGINSFIGWLNSITISVPGVHVGPVQFDGISIGLPKIPFIPRLAMGGVVPPGGMAIVGDPGPNSELVYGGRSGASVYSHTQSSSILAAAVLQALAKSPMQSGGGVIVVHNHIHLDEREIGESVERYQLATLRSQGGVRG